MWRWRRLLKAAVHEHAIIPYHPNTLTRNVNKNTYYSERNSSNFSPHVPVCELLCECMTVQDLVLGRESSCV